MTTSALDEVIANEELSRRAARRDRGDQLHAQLAALSNELGSSPRRVLQKLTDTTLGSCKRILRA